VGQDYSRPTRLDAELTRRLRRTEVELPRAYTADEGLPLNRGEPERGSQLVLRITDKNLLLINEDLDTPIGTASCALSPGRSGRSVRRHGHLAFLTHSSIDSTKSSARCKAARAQNYIGGWVTINMMLYGRRTPRPGPQKLWSILGEGVLSPVATMGAPGPGGGRGYRAPNA
jgi:hypothetical protein